MKKEINIIERVIAVYSIIIAILLVVILYVFSLATEQELLFDKYVNATDSLIHEMSVQNDTFSDVIAEKDVWYNYTQVRKEIK